MDTFENKFNEISSDINLIKVLNECSSKHFTEIKYFSKDGKSLPNGIGLQRSGFLAECHTNEMSFVLTEDVNEDQYGLSKYRGGVIVFSTKVNAVELSKNGLINWMKQHWASIFQRFNTPGILKKLITRFNKKEMDEREEKIKNASSDEERANIEPDWTKRVGSYSIGNAFKGRYIDDKGNVYDEESTTIEVNGLSTESLLRFGELIAKEFHQQTVLIKDLNENKIYLANDKIGNGKPDLSNINTEC